VLEFCRISLLFEFLMIKYKFLTLFNCNVRKNTYLCSVKCIFVPSKQYCYNLLNLLNNTQRYVKQ